MSVFDWIKQRIVGPPEPFKPVEPVKPPPLDPEAAARHSEAMRRRAADVLRLHYIEKYALDYGVLPTLPPSVGWYENHPDYKWNPLEPNPEDPPPKPPDIKPPKPQPTPKDGSNFAAATKSWQADWDRFKKMPHGGHDKPKSQPPSISYYFQHPGYIWNPQAEQVR